MELLTGQCNKDFDTWREQRYDQLIDENKTEWTYYGYSVFNELCFSMQWGVYKEFFAGKGFFIDIVSYLDFDDNFQFYWCHLNDCYVLDEKNNTDEFKKIESAMEAGIKRANELYNEKHLNNIQVQQEEIKKDEKQRKL